MSEEADRSKTTVSTAEESKVATQEAPGARSSEARKTKAQDSGDGSKSKVDRVPEETIGKSEATGRGAADGEGTKKPASASKSDPAKSAKAATKGSTDEANRKSALKKEVVEHALKKAGKKDKEKQHYFKRKLNSITGDKSNGEALSFIVAAIIFVIIASFIDNPAARKRLMPEYRIINNHLFDMQNDFSTALIISLRKKHQYSAHSQPRKRFLTQDEYNQNLIDKMFSADFFARHGLTDIVAGSKA